MSVAAQLAVGNGFTTRWLEHPFLSHPDLPRPDDFRYPVFTLLLAAVFKVFGTSYTAGLWTVGVLHLVLILLVYLVGRKRFGSGTACTAMLLASVSLLQLYWNSRVYVEALSGCWLGLIVGWAECGPLRKPGYPLIMGALLGIFYLVRPNGILMAGGLLFLYGRNYGEMFRNRKAILTALAVTLMFMIPWLVRTAVHFGNPFHIATGAGLLRAGASDPLTLRMSEFITKYGIFHLLKATAIGMAHLFSALHFFEHGLEVVPLAGFVAGTVLFRRRYSPMIVTGICLTLLACGYVAYNYSWAGVRYLCSFLPWIYMYGIATLSSGLTLLCSRFPGPLRSLASPLLAFILVLPVINPHRYYERTLPSSPRYDPAAISGYTRLLSDNLGDDSVYCAGVMAQLNFLTPYLCVGMHEFFDSTHVPMVIRRFRPKLLVLTGEELGLSRIRAVFRAFKRNRIKCEEIYREKDIHFFELAPR